LMPVPLFTHTALFFSHVVVSGNSVLVEEKSSQKGSARAGKDSVRAALLSLLGDCLSICTIFSCEKALNELATPIARRVLTKTERLTFSIQQLKFRVQNGSLNPLGAIHK